ncbi:hypothetical protein [Sphingopyxis sp. Geo24]|uniref:hypothetical protein n=1 Tax=Sphingopyxis sp. Geo24 TaxID=340058 RepID=UPI0024AE61B1|nr:hypothetical protein [Sphingopyxis sp. Geo24]
MISVNLEGWAKDAMFSPYPEGSRDKYAVIAPEAPDNSAIIPCHRYLMKFSNPRYPAQFWSEIIAAEIGCEIGVPVPPCFYSLDPATGTPGSLSEWFFGDAIEAATAFTAGPIIADPHDIPDVPESAPTTHSLYVAGSAYMARHIKDYDLKTGKQHNLRSISVLMKRFGQIWPHDHWPHWAKVLTFDAIIGNTDRHQDNWGILWRSDEAGKLAPRFSPAFDNGTSLLHEIMEERLDRFADSEAVERYIKRGRHHMKWNVDDVKSAGHIEMIESIIKDRPALIETIAATINVDWGQVFERVAVLRDVASPVPLTQARLEAILSVVARRVEILKSVISI